MPNGTYERIKEFSDNHLFRPANITPKHTLICDEHCLLTDHNNYTLSVELHIECKITH